jgi:hypothetical protein
MKESNKIEVRRRRPRCALAGCDSDNESGACRCEREINSSPGTRTFLPATFELSRFNLPTALPPSLPSLAASFPFLSGYVIHLVSESRADLLYILRCLRRRND